MFGNPVITTTTSESYTFVMPGVLDNLLTITEIEQNASGMVSRGKSVFGNFTLSTVAIRDNDVLNATLSVYPNPASDKVFVSVSANGNPIAQVLLYNSLGEVVQSQTIPASAGVVNGVVELSSLPAGLYHLQVQQNGASASRTVIVK